ncbi:MAG: aminoglycoside phosphotransferase family protein [Dehalococcoidia bacterium]|nr:aminoglycoside phosphotransferase family protein [Dehalococcoidia bacterium]
MPPIPEAARLLTPQIRARLAEVLPDADAAGASFLGQGWGSAAFLVPAPGAPAGDWVLRLPRPQAPWAVEDLEREVRLLPFLERRPFEVHTPREARMLTDAAGATLGALHRLVPGTPLSERAAPRGRVRADLCAQIGRFLSVLHASPHAEAKRHGARDVDLWTTEYRGRIEEACAVLPPGARTWLEREAAEFEARGGTSDVRRALIHSDLSGDHFILDESGLAGVIDFADARIADPAMDFAGVLNHLGPRDLEQVWAHYDGEVDQAARYRTRFYIRVAPIFQVVDGFIAIGPDERRKGIRRLAAHAGHAARTGLGDSVP